MPRRACAVGELDQYRLASVALQQFDHGSSLSARQVLLGYVCQEGDRCE